MSEEVRTKACTKCGVEKIATAEFFHRDARKTDGLRPYCADCARAAAVARDHKIRGVDAERLERKKDEAARGLKTCTKCQRTHPATTDFFSPNSATESRLDSWCQECRNEAQKKRYRNSLGSEPTRYEIRDALLARGLKACSRCGETKPATAEFFVNNSKGAGGVGSWCIECSRAHARETGRNRVLTDEQKERRREYSRALNARRKLTGYYAEYTRNRYASDAKFALDRRMSSAIYLALKNAGSSKSGRKWEDNVDYTLEELYQHLEKLFVEGMSWDNMGEWHVDHIRPKSSFTYENSDDPEFKECWALSNLQPLWAEDNWSKHARLDWVPANDTYQEQIKCAQ